jgi:hypothetical protein
MKRKHPLDEVFRRKLESYEVDTPPNLWDKIEGKRNLKYRTLYEVRKRLPILLVFILILATSILLFLHASQSAPTHYFPIPLDAPDDQQASKSQELAELPTPLALKPTVLLSQNNSSPIPAKQIECHPSKKWNEEKLKTRSAKLITSNQDDQLPVKPTPEKSYPSDIPKIRWFPSSPRCPRFGSSGGKFYVEALFSPELPFRSITARRPELEEYVALRESSEEQDFAYTVSLRASFKPNKNLAIRTGLSYAQINEKFNYFNENEVRTIIKEIYDAQGAIIGVDTIVEVGTRYKVTNNRYRMLDIPILLGYEFTSGPFILSVNAGALINIMSRQKGDVLSPDDLSPVSINSGSTSDYPAFKQQVGLGWYASLGLAYPVKPDIELIVEPYIRAYSGSLTVDQYGVSQEYIHAGINLGLKKQLWYN